MTEMNLALEGKDPADMSCVMDAQYTQYIEKLHRFIIGFSCLSMGLLIVLPSLLLTM